MMPKALVELFYMAAWTAAVVFAAWVLYSHGHDAWAAVVALAGVLKMKFV